MPDPTAAPPAPPTPPASDSKLPESANIKPAAVVAAEMRADIDRYFDGQDGAPAVVTPKLPPGEAIPAALPEVKIGAKPEPPPVGSLAAKLAAAKKPAPVDAPKADVPLPVEDPIAKAEAEFKAHNPKWKPADGWNTVKSALQAQKERTAQLEKDLEAAKARASAPVLAGLSVGEIEQLKQREKEASDRLMLVDLENHPAFRAQYVEPKQSEIARANELLSAHGIKTDVASLLQKPRSELGKAVSELVKDLPDFDRVEVADAVRKAHQLDQGAKQALGNSKELQKGLQAQTVQRQREAFARRWAPVSAALGEHIIELEIPAEATPAERASIEDYNNSLKSLRTKAEEIAFSPLGDEAIAEAAMKAAAYDFHIGKAMPRILSEYEIVVNMNRQLVEELRAIKGRNPNHAIRGDAEAAADGKQAGNTGDLSKDADYWFNKK